MQLKEFLKEYGDSFQNCVTFVDIDSKDQPLIYVNKTFEELTGYPRSEILNRNCRFLQGDETDKNAAMNIRESILKGEPVCQDLINYKKDGTAFGNRLVLVPIKEADRRYYLGMQIEQPLEKVSQQRKINNTFEISDRILNPLTVLILSLSKYSIDNKEFPIDQLAVDISGEFKKIRDYVESL